jgi:hypothetical protein
MVLKFEAFHWHDLSDRHYIHLNINLDSTNSVLQSLTRSNIATRTSGFATSGLTASSCTVQLLYSFLRPAGDTFPCSLPASPDNFKRPPRIIPSLYIGTAMERIRQSKYSPLAESASLFLSSSIWWSRYDKKKLFAGSLGRIQTDNLESPVDSMVGFWGQRQRSFSDRHLSARSPIFLYTQISDCSLGSILLVYEPPVKFVYCANATTQFGNGWILTDYCDSHQGREIFMSTNYAKVGMSTSSRTTIPAARKPILHPGDTYIHQANVASGREIMIYFDWRPVCRRISI